MLPLNSKNPVSTAIFYYCSTTISISFLAFIIHFLRNSHRPWQIVTSCKWKLKRSKIDTTYWMAMAPHSSTLAWRIPGMGASGGLLSMGSQRVGHDWSDLAAAAATLDYNAGFAMLANTPLVVVKRPSSLSGHLWKHKREAFMYLGPPWQRLCNLDP